MQLTKLSEVGHRLIKNLSKGYRQRVGFAQAILGFPDIIILDEPTVGLDPKQIIEIRELIRGLAKKHTVILSTHILAEAREVCDEILIISKGKLVASDTPEHLELLMNGAEMVEIETKAQPETVRTILSNVHGIRTITTETIGEGEPQEKTTLAKMEVEEGQDIREAVFYAFAKSEYPLLMLKTSKASLEEIFIELTQGEEEHEHAGHL